MAPQRPVAGILTIFTPMPTIAPDEFLSFALFVNLHVLEDGGQELRGDGEQDGRAGGGSWRLYLRQSAADHS